MLPKHLSHEGNRVGWETKPKRGLGTSYLPEIRRKAVPQRREAEAGSISTLYYRFFGCWLYRFQHQKKRRRRKKNRKRENDTAVD